MTQSHRIDRQQKGDVIVRAPRSTDAIGQTLRRAYDCASLPADMQAALHRIDRAPRRH